MITTLDKIAWAQFALLPKVSINVSTRYETKTRSRPRSRPKQCNPVNLDQESENTVSRLSRDETVSWELTSLVSGRLQVYINMLDAYREILHHLKNSSLYHNLIFGRQPRHSVWAASSDRFGDDT